jgi:hypothetical protein
MSRQTTVYTKQDKYYIPQTEVGDKDRQVFELINRVRVDPQIVIPHLEAMRQRFDGLLFKQPNKTTLKTVEGVNSVRDAIAFL